LSFKNGGTKTPFHFDSEPAEHNEIPVILYIKTLSSYSLYGELTITEKYSDFSTVVKYNNCLNNYLPNLLKECSINV
jgi:hypothetical protein